MNLISKTEKELAQVNSKIDALNDRNEAIAHELKKRLPWQVRMKLIAERTANNARLAFLDQVAFELQEAILESKVKQA